MTTGTVFDVQRFSVHDGPGIRTTVFFKGCPLECWWCHNPESQLQELELMLWEKRCIGCGACLEVCTQGAISRENGLISTDRGRCVVCGACVEACYAEARELVGREMTVAQVMAEIERDVPFYDQSGGGVTFSGGEPLAQLDFLLAALRACKRRGIHTALDTCGFAPWEALDAVRKWVDLFLYDLKLMDDADHRKFTGVSNRVILDNLEALSRRGHDVILRVPIVPGINDDDEHVRQIGRFAATLPCLKRVDVLPYHSIAAEKYHRLGKAYKLSETPLPVDERVAEIAQVWREFGLEVKIGG